MSSKWKSDAELLWEYSEDIIDSNNRMLKEIERMIASNNLTIVWMKLAVAAMVLTVLALLILAARG